MDSPASNVSTSQALSPSYRGLTAEQRGAAEGVLRELSTEHRFRLTFFSGSLAAGLGHANSDIDIHAILAPNDALERRTFRVADHRIQITLIDEGILRRTASLTRAYSVTRLDRDQATLEGLELWNLIRTCVSELVGGENELIEVYRSINSRVAAQVLMAVHSTEVGRAAEDALGMLRRGDTRGASYVAMSAFREAAEVGLAASGDLYSLPKFLWARVNRSLAFRKLLPDAWRLLAVGPSWGDANLERSIEDVLAAAQQIVADSLVGGWDHPLAEVRLPTRCAGLRRNPYAGLLRFSDAWAITLPTGPLRVSEDISVCWAALCGQGMDDVADELRMRGLSLEEGELDRVLKKLVERGVVSQVSE